MAYYSDLKLTDFEQCFVIWDSLRCVLVDQLAASHAKVGLEHVRLKGAALALSRQVDLRQQLLVCHRHL